MIERATLVATVLILAACTGSSSPVETTSLPPPVSSAPLAGLDCSGGQLLTPEGVQVDVTGTWHGGSMVHYLRQVGRCVWASALSDFPEEEAPGSYWTMVFTGRIGTDFILRGEWAYIVSPAGIVSPTDFTSREGFGSLRIVFPAGQPHATELRVVAGTYAEYENVTLEYVGPLPRGDASD